MATKGNKPFLCGVVEGIFKVIFLMTAIFFICFVSEGFYGRPWSTGQRLDLFNW